MKSDIVEKLKWPELQKIDWLLSQGHEPCYILICFTELASKYFFFLGFGFFLLLSFEAVKTDKRTHINCTQNSRVQV